VVCILDFYAVHSQPPNPSTKISKLIFDQWTGDDGLISNNLTSARQTSDDYIWVTSFNGVLRFDGVNFELFNQNNLPFLNSNAFYSISEDSNGTLYFATQASGVIVYKDNKFKPLQPKNELPKSVRVALMDTQGRLWLGANNIGTFVIEDSIVKKIDNVSVQNTSILDLLEDAQGTIWIGTENKGLTSIRKDGLVKTYSEEDGLYSSSIVELYAGPSGDLYIGTTKGLNRIRNGVLSKLPFCEGVQVNSVVMDINNSL